MKLLQFAIAVALSALPVSILLAAEPDETHWFHFDKADEIVPSTMLENRFAYDAGIATSKNGLWLAWLEFVPGKGDELWVGLRGKDGWKSKTKFSEQPGDYANPTPTAVGDGEAWLSYEKRARTNASFNPNKWDILAHRIGVDKVSSALSFGERFGIEAMGPGGPTRANIQHRAVINRFGGIWIVWQAAVGGRFQTCCVSITDGPAGMEPRLISGTPGNDWSPSAAVGSDGSLHIVWDSYTGESYDVLKCTVRQSPPSPEAPPIKSPVLAASPRFEANAQIAADKNGKLWVSWEEDGENWGGRYTARLPGRKDSTHMTDKVGPVHRFRKLHLAELDEKNAKLTEYEIPQPSFELARNRTNTPADLRDFGAFYEKAQLVVDGKNRPWIVYRHFYVPWIGIELATHKQQNMRVYARCLLPNGWSKLYSFAEGQGDGMQRISASATPDGVAVAWTTGRTDRRNTKDPHGVAFAEIKLNDTKAIAPAKTHERKLDFASTESSPKPRKRPSAEVAGKHYELFYGDLHRHTDISLCFSPADGTIDDAYRYAIDVASLDFLGITDHTHDLQSGEPLAHIWWRSRKEVDRHALTDGFIPFYSYERSRGDTDHNVISLRDDILHPHNYPLPEFWKELDTNTITIPHQPFNPVLWKNKDDTHRTLLEIYQGMRNNICETDMQKGLSGGHHFGIISSSDHLSTGASFACVWAEQPTRESLFRAMQARRTFGATAKAVLKVTCDGHWMGEEFELKQMKPITVKITATAPITGLELIVDGKPPISVADLLQGPVGSELTWEIPPDPSLTGKHIFFVRVTQADGNHAWASPLWIEIKP